MKKKTDTYLCLQNSLTLNPQLSFIYRPARAHRTSDTITYALRLLRNSGRHTPCNMIITNDRCYNYRLSEYRCKEKQAMFFKQYARKICISLVPMLVWRRYKLKVVDHCVRWNTMELFCCFIVINESHSIHHNKAV